MISTGKAFSQPIQERISHGTQWFWSNLSFDDWTQFLERPLRVEVKRIAVGNPKTVPAGRYAEEALRHFHLWDGLKDKLIFAENVRQVLDYVARNEVDAGLGYSTDAARQDQRSEDCRESPCREPSSPSSIRSESSKGQKRSTWQGHLLSSVISPEGQRFSVSTWFSRVIPLNRDGYLGRYGFFIAFFSEAIVAGRVSGDRLCRPGRDGNGLSPGKKKL